MGFGTPHEQRHGPLLDFSPWQQQHFFPAAHIGHFGLDALVVVSATTFIAGVDDGIVGTVNCTASKTMLINAQRARRTDLSVTELRAAHLDWVLNSGKRQLKAMPQASHSTALRARFRPDKTRQFPTNSGVLCFVNLSLLS